MQLEPEAKELFKRLRKGLPLGDLGLSNAQTPPSPAVVDVDVVDVGSNGVAAQVHDLLAKAGFLAEAPTTTNGFGIEGPAIVFAPNPQGKAAADVVKGFLGKVPEVRDASGTLEGNQVAEFSEKPQVGEGWINGGFFVLDRKVLDYIDGEETHFQREPLERLAQDGQLMAFKHTSFWQCMDTLRDKILLQQLWDSDRPPWKVWN